MEEVEDEEDRLHRAKPKLASDSRYILENVNEYQRDTGTKEKVRESTKKTKTEGKSQPTPTPKTEYRSKRTDNSNKSKNRPTKVPVRYDSKVKDRIRPDTESKYGPSLHTRHEYQGIDSVTGEILLAHLEAALEDVHYDPPREDEEENKLLAELRDGWIAKAADLLTGVPDKLPPFREINHKIPLIDEKKQYNYHLPRCAEAMKPQLLEKIDKYTKAGWWEEATVHQAAPMLCIPKKDGVKLRTALDARKRNDNTEKDVTPFPDQEHIRTDVARGKYRSKIDMSNAYEQIRVEPSDVWKTAFAIFYGTFLSHTMKIGAANPPA